MATNGIKLTLADVIGRSPTPHPWKEGEKIPWDDRDFSQRMLREHLSQAHDAASRRSEIIDRQIDWIHSQVMASKPGRILDLGCGPGLYTSRLAQRGHQCVGIDFSPASVAYARAAAQAEGLACTYLHEDIRRAGYGDGYHLVMFIYGEFNVFQPSEAQLILKKGFGALEQGGYLLLEVSTFDAVRRLGQRSPDWYASRGGLFSQQPHLCLQERSWDAAQCVTTERYYIIDSATGSVTRYASSSQAYSEKEYRTMLTACGFRDIQLYPELGGGAHAQSDFQVIVGKK